MSESQLVGLLLNKNTEITNRFSETITEILRLGIDSERSKEKIINLLDGVRYSVDELERILRR